MSGSLIVICECKILSKGDTNNGNIRAVGIAERKFKKTHTNYQSCEHLEEGKELLNLTLSLVTVQAFRRQMN